METFASLFDGAGDDAEAEATLRAVTSAQVEAQDCWAFLALAQSEAEFGHRLALSEDRLASIAARHGVSFEDVTAQFRTAFEALHPKESASEHEAAGALSCKNCGHANPSHRKGGLCPCGCESYQPDVRRSASKITSRKVAGRDEWEHDCVNCGKTSTSTSEHMDCPNCGEKAEEVYTTYKGKTSAKEAGKRGPSYDPDSVDDLQLNGTSSNPIYYYNEGYDHGRSGTDYKGYGGRDKAILYGHGYRHGNKDAGGKESARDPHDYPENHQHEDDGYGRCQECSQDIPTEARDQKGHEFTSPLGYCKHCGMDRPEPGDYIPGCRDIQRGFGDLDHEASKSESDACHHCDGTGKNLNHRNLNCVHCGGSGTRKESARKTAGPVDDMTGDGTSDSPQQSQNQGGAKPGGGGSMHLPSLPGMPKIPGMGGGGAAAGAGEAAGAAAAGEGAAAGLAELAPLLLLASFDQRLALIRQALEDGQDPLALLYDTSAAPTPSHHETTEQFMDPNNSAMDAAMQQGGGSAQPENPGGHTTSPQVREGSRPFG